MLPRPRWLVGLGCAVLLFAAGACQALPAARAIPTATAQPTASAPAAVAGFKSVVWARIPFCSCLDGIATDNVSAALKRAQLAGTVKLLNPTDGWRYFVVGFDPDTASRDQIATAIKAGGGEVLAGPP